MAKGPSGFIQNLMSGLVFKSMKKKTLKNTKSEPYTDEWWEDMTNALSFVPEEQRKMILDGIVGLGVAF
jgi:hypothetical protein